MWDVAIGQSTVATGRVVANLFYRGLLLRRPVRLGDTLRTTTEVVARRENRVKEGRRPTGLAVLRIRTVDQEDRPVLDFTRCAMLPLRDEPTGEPGDEVGGAADLDAEPLRAAAARAGPRRLPRRRARPALRRRPGRLGGARSRAATSSTPRPSSRG